MKEIKFKFYDKKENLTYFSADFDSLGDFFIFHETHYKKCELNEYTGLKDKNGIDCYEGDIVEVYGGFKHEVKFASGSFRFGDFLDPTSYLDSDTFEVIGNIYKNQELLEFE